ncbi:hypothetical protein MBANPS3_009859 [Mucor bainieri]
MTKFHHLQLELIINRHLNEFNIAALVYKELFKVSDLVSAQGKQLITDAAANPAIVAIFENISIVAIAPLIAIAPSLANKAIIKWQQEQQQQEQQQEQQQQEQQQQNQQQQECGEAVDETE